MNLTIKLLKEMIKEELNRIEEETAYNKLKRLSDEAGIGRDWFPLNFSRGSSFKGAMMAITPLIDNRKAIVSNEINRIHGGYTIYVHPRVKEQAVALISKKDPTAAEDMHVPHRVNEDEDPHHDDASQGEYDKEKEKMRKRMYGKTGHDASRPLNKNNPFYLKEKKK